MKQINLVATVSFGNSMVIYVIDCVEGLSLFKFADMMEDIFSINIQIPHVYTHTQS